MFVVTMGAYFYLASRISFLARLFHPARKAVAQSQVVLHGRFDHCDEYIYLLTWALGNE
jgi:hypothetical protein